MREEYIGLSHILGLLAGILFLNYMVKHHTNSVSELYEILTSLKHIDDVNKKSMLLAILYKRIKQWILLSCLRFSSCKGIAGYSCTAYYGFVLGILFSLFYYYKGMPGICYGILCSVPLTLYYILLIWHEIKTIDNKRIKRDNDRLLGIIGIKILFVLVVFLEYFFSLWLAHGFFVDR